jgi:hypothetical protein
MSTVTTKLLSGVNYDSVIKKRKRNYLFVHENLQNINELNINIAQHDVPNYYPLMVGQKRLRAILIKRNIFIPTLWPGMDQFINSTSFEAKLVNELLPIPIDQRLSINHMKYIIDNINEIINSLVKQ